MNSREKMSYGRFPDFFELDRRVIYELPLLGGEHLAGLLHEPNLAHGFIENPSNPLRGEFSSRKSKKPTIETDLIDLDGEKGKKRDKSNKREREKSVRFGRSKVPHPPTAVTARLVPPSSVQDSPQNEINRPPTR